MGRDGREPEALRGGRDQLAKVNEGRGYRLTVLQIQRCPWCGSTIGARDVRAVKAKRRVYVHCSDDLAGCPFAQGGAVHEGLPVLTVDEEIYRLAPAFVIATVDKFARLAREGEAASLFGYVAKRCDRHGFVHPVHYRHRHLGSALATFPSRCRAEPSEARRIHPLRPHRHRTSFGAATCISATC
ncbi:MAG: hypothetical protein ACRDT0_13845 [Pseudonocardiaceae bacterium]